MKLVIRAQTLRNEPLSQAIMGRFDEQGGTIGRSDTNTMALPDAERHVSRLQAEVAFSDGAFSIRNVGSSNPIMVNGRLLNPGERVPMVGGEVLVIGGYAMRTELEVEGAAIQAQSEGRVVAKPQSIIAASAGEPKTNPRGSSASAHGRSAVQRGFDSGPHTPAGVSGAASERLDDPFADLMGGSGVSAEQDPFADLMSPSPAGGSSAPSPAFAAAPAPALPARPSNDADPFGDLASPATGSADDAMADFMGSGSAAAPPRQAASSASHPPQTDDQSFAHLIGTSQEGSAASLDVMFELDTPGSPGADPMDIFLASPEPARGADNKDPLAEFLAPASSAPAPAAPAIFNHTPELASAYRPPAVQAPPKASKAVNAPLPSVNRPRRPDAGANVPASPVKPLRVVGAPTASNVAPSDGAGSNEALWAAFCEGANVSLQPPQGLNPDLMRIIGQLLHHSIEGTLKLMAVRTAAKQELRVPTTTIETKNNNPLKFSADTAAALSQLLQPPMRGFMMAPDAVHDAMDDLLGHSIGTMTGMRAALQGMLRRFEPARLEANLSSHGVMDTLLPMSRRAKLWELYLKHYDRVRDDAQEDFHELFGRAFVKAYEEQLDRLAASRRQRD